MKLHDFIKELQELDAIYKDIDIAVERTDPCSNEYTCLDPFVYVEPYVYVESNEKPLRVIISADD